MIFVPWVIFAGLVLSSLIFIPHTSFNIGIVRVAAAGILIRAIFACVYYWTAEYGITDKRVLGKTGLLIIHSLDILLLKVEAVRLRQGIFGRIFNYGDLIVSGTGGTQHVLHDLPNPRWVRNIIQEHANKAHSTTDGLSIKVN